MCNYAQGLFAAYTIAHPELLDSREDLYAAILRREQCVREAGFDPVHAGHRPVGYQNCEHTWFEDEMINYLKRHGLAGYPGVPAQGVNYTDAQRTWTYYHAFDLVMAWKQGVEPLGEDYAHQWVEGRETEEDWFDMMKELVVWWDEHKPKELHGFFEGTLHLLSSTRRVYPKRLCRYPLVLMTVSILCSLFCMGVISMFTLHERHIVDPVLNHKLSFEVLVPCNLSCLSIFNPLSRVCEMYSRNGQRHCTSDT